MVQGPCTCIPRHCFLQGDGRGGGALALVCYVEVISKSSLAFLKGERDLFNCQIVGNVRL